MGIGIGTGMGVGSGQPMLLVTHSVPHVALAVVTAPHTAATTVASSGCPGLDALNPVCQLGSIGGSVVGGGIDAVLSGLSQWVAGGAEWLLSQIGAVLVSTTTIDLGANWFHAHYTEMLSLAAVVLLPLLLVSTLQAVYRQNPGQLIRAFLVQLPLALLLGLVAIQIVILCLSATDAMCTAVAGGSSSAVTSLLSGVSNGLVGALGDPTMATFVLLLVGLLVAVAAFVLWLELLVRAAAVYVAVLFLPLALATLVWPSVSHWCRRLVETLAALILSKFVIVATLSLAASAVASGTAGTSGTAGAGTGGVDGVGGGGSGFASVLAGGALLVLATFVPFAILRLIPIAEAGAINHLEGARQRGMAAMTSVPRTAATFALREGMAAHRAAGGAARLAAVTGPPGTGGGAGGAGGADGGSDGDGDGSGGGEDGGLRPDANGMAIGIPPTPSEESEVEDPANPASQPKERERERGPKPVLPVGGRRGGGASVSTSARSAGSAAGSAAGRAADPSPPAPTAPALHPVGPPAFNGLQHAIGRDRMGPVLTYVRPDDTPDVTTPPARTAT